MPELSDVQLKQIKGLLNEQRAGLVAEVRAELENSGEQQYIELLGRDPADAGDASVAEVLADLNVARMDRQIHELRAINIALGRLREGTIGACTDCGAEIPFERLVAYPTADRCIPCQEQHERLYAGEGHPKL